MAQSDSSTPTVEVNALVCVRIKNLAIKELVEERANVMAVVSHDRDVASTKLGARKIFVLQIGVHIFISKWFLLNLFSGPLLFSSGLGIFLHCSWNNIRRIFIRSIWNMSLTWFCYSDVALGYLELYRNWLVIVTHSGRFTPEERALSTLRPVLK